MTDLTKWPRLLVQGKRVTEEQANEILIRTCCPEYLGSSNDRAFVEQVNQVMGYLDWDHWHEIPELREDSTKRIAWMKERWAQRDNRTEELGILGLEYLYTSRIVSAYLFGPHGWCDWNGNIFCDNYNIGKWPSTGVVTDEWGQIADAFPYLDLRAQLITREGEGELAGEWRVKDGTVSYNPTPAVQLTLEKPQITDEGHVLAAVADIVNGRTDRERGVSLERLEQAVAQVEAAQRGRDSSV